MMMANSLRRSEVQKMRELNSEQTIELTKTIDLIRSLGEIEVIYNVDAELIIEELCDMVELGEN